MAGYFYYTSAKLHIEGKISDFKVKNEFCADISYINCTLVY